MGVQSAGDSTYSSETVGKCYIFGSARDGQEHPLQVGTLGCDSEGRQQIAGIIPHTLGPQRKGTAVHPFSFAADHLLRLSGCIFAESLSASAAKFSKRITLLVFLPLTAFVLASALPKPHAFVSSVTLVQWFHLLNTSLLQLLMMRPRTRCTRARRRQDCKSGRAPLV